MILSFLPYVNMTVIFSLSFRKDVYGIFSYPVTDAIAPNYSKIIKNPMDFSTMMFKIENRQYPNIETFKVSHFMFFFVYFTLFYFYVKSKLEYNKLTLNIVILVQKLELFHYFTGCHVLKVCQCCFAFLCP